MIQLCVWKQGRVNIEILKNMFCSAIKYAGWDLAMEYQILTPALKLTDSNEFATESGMKQTKKLCYLFVTLTLTWTL